MPAAARPSPPIQWLSSASFDVALYSGITLYGAVVVLALAREVEPSRIFLWFNVVFTLGHYAPTWLRAFGERDVFRNNRAQILLFPVLFAAVAYVSRGQPLALAFVTYFWDRYHALMQNYGFLRLYDAAELRARGTVMTSGRAELGLLVSSAVLLVSFNMGLLTPVLALLYRIGVPLDLSPALVRALRIAAASCAAVAATAYIVASVRRARAGGGWSPAKNLFLFSAIGGHLLMNSTTNIFLLSAHEKLYHSVQYIALVWHDRRRRNGIATTPPSGALRALSGRWGWMAYLMAIAAWCAAVFVIDRLLFHGSSGSSFHTTAFSTLLAALALTHYFYDSFLWRAGPKAREADG